MNIERAAGDLMVALDSYATVHQDSTIAEALEELASAQADSHGKAFKYRAVLVLDDAGRVVGKLSQWAILRALEPQLLKNQALAAILTHSGVHGETIARIEEDLANVAGSFDRLCQRAALVKVREAMVPTPESLDINTPLMKAIHQLVIRHVQSILVTRDDKVVGLLRLADVFEEVERRIRDAGAG